MKTTNQNQANQVQSGVKAIVSACAIGALTLFAAPVSAATTPASISLIAPQPTPLCMAIVKGETEIVKKFIEYGVNVNESSDGMSPLMLAARYNKLEILQHLLENGARVDDKSKNGYTALKWAEVSNAKDTADYLKNYKRK